jgi:hypothetical protein
MSFQFLYKSKIFIKIKWTNRPSTYILPSYYYITPEVLLFPFKSGGLVNEVAMPITIRKQIIFATKWVIKLLKDNLG